MLLCRKFKINEWFPIIGTNCNMLFKNITFQTRMLDFLVAMRRNEIRDNYF